MFIFENLSLILISKIYFKRNDNGQDVYAHYSAIINKNPNHRVRSLADGELVQFNIIEGSKGAEAADITGVNGSPVQGSEYARPKNSSPTSNINNSHGTSVQSNRPKNNPRNMPPNRPMNPRNRPPMNNYNGGPDGMHNPMNNNNYSRGAPRQRNFTSPKQNRRIPNVNGNGLIAQPPNLPVSYNQNSNGFGQISTGGPRLQNNNYMSNQYMDNNSYNNNNYNNRQPSRFLEYITIVF